MLAVLIALCFSANVDGGWNSIDVDSEQIKAIKGYLDKNIPRLFPEIQNENGYIIASAKMQVVAGMNLKLNIKAASSPLLFQITLYVDLKQKVTIQEITRPIGSKPIVGGYTWQNPSHYTASDLANLVRALQSKYNILLQKEGRVLVYRTKVEKGLKSHVIFRDTRNMLVSAVSLKSPNSNLEEIVSYSLIQ